VGSPIDGATDIDDVDRLQSLRWGAAIGAWQRGDATSLQAALRDEDLPLSAAAREFLSDLAAGTAVRRAGVKAKYSGEEERAIAVAVFRRWEHHVATRSGAKDGSPRDRAIDDVSVDLKMSVDAVRGVVDRLRPAGFTLDWWQSVGRPGFAE